MVVRVFQESSVESGFFFPFRQFHLCYSLFKFWVTKSTSPYTSWAHVMGGVLIAISCWICHFLIYYVIVVIIPYCVGFLSFFFLFYYPYIWFLDEIVRKKGMLDMLEATIPCFFSQKFKLSFSLSFFIFICKQERNLG
ncbi:hypothetical protein GGI43DRAFT_294414 [Trichoderma evansii]